MSTQRKIYLLKFRNNSKQRWHFAIYLQNPAYENVDPADKTKHSYGHLIHVVGTPMNGYIHEFVTNFAPERTASLREAPLLGKITVPAGYIIDPANDDENHEKRHVAQDQLEKAASTVAPPRKSENFMAPVDGVKNRRCQEWTMDFLKLLVTKGFITQSAYAIAQAQRDPPSHGVGLQPITRTAAGSTGMTQTNQTTAGSSSSGTSSSARPSPPPKVTGPKVGDIRKKDNKIEKWDGKNWVIKK
ncbi:hypothetical protein N0V82_009657 [Gnomoniopsis sp. IMI 355080]|nr:hypothetical protein N0V82_009657 [Gnomoniopsis sp. IMI 355080]